MIITESDRIVLIAIAAGFLSGSCQSFLSYILDKNERQLLNNRQFLTKLLYISFYSSIILGIMAFFSVWDTSMPTGDLNRFTIAMAAFLAISPLYDRLWSLIFSRFKMSKRKNTTNN